MRTLIILCSLLLPLYQATYAATIQATGSALIQNADIDSARERAISRATEQASLLAMAQISVTQSVRDGILEIDNLRVNTQASIGEVSLISETRSGDRLEVLIEAQITPNQGCADSNEATAYRKPVALAQWTMRRPAQANWGRLHSLSIDLPGYLMQKLENVAHLKLIDARQYRLPDYSELSPSASLLRAQGAADLRTQYLLNAQIESLAMAKEASDTPNILVDLAEKTGLKLRDDERFFSVRVDLIEAYTGDLLQRYQLQTSGAWTASTQGSQPTSFVRFAQEPYGKAVLIEIDNLANQLSESLACQPLRANILSVDGSGVWVDQGADAGINSGDRLSVARRVQLYDQQMRVVSSVEPTNLYLVIERTEFNRAYGRLSQPTDIAGIQPGDIVIGY
ncbi:MAG TPA: flagellar assembly protein T N-terminal domain-containing protein [Marinobacterium sp.]|nr:flagellar assembly protein T N-terminal domain-containing protein [Marinobacterium sp.]